MADFPRSAAAVGITVPGVMKRGVVHSAPNIDPAWIGTDADALFSEALGREVHLINDADAAGLAEVEYGAARGRRGLVIVTTLGTGIGSALVHDGVLVPNSELGHVQIDGRVAEQHAANSIRERDDLSWQEWAGRLTVYYRTLERLFTPELFVVGGGVSQQSEEFLPLIEIDTEIVPATLRNRAGIIGAALLGQPRGREPQLAADRRLPVGELALPDPELLLGAPAPPVAGDRHLVTGQRPRSPSSQGRRPRITVSASPCTKACTRPGSHARPRTASSSEPVAAEDDGHLRPGGAGQHRLGGRAVDLEQHPHHGVRRPARRGRPARR